MTDKTEHDWKSEVLRAAAAKLHDYAQCIPLGPSHDSLHELARQVASLAAAPTPPAQEPAKADPAMEKMRVAAGYWQAFTHAVSMASGGAALEVESFRGRRHWVGRFGNVTARRLTPEGAFGCAISLAFHEQGMEVPEAYGLPPSTLPKLVFSGGDNDPVPTPPAQEAQPAWWRVHLICCGRDDGYVHFPTWEDADRFRDDYTRGPGVHPNGYSAPEHAHGHKRAAIVEALYALPPDAARRIRELEAERDRLREAAKRLLKHWPAINLDGGHDDVEFARAALGRES